MLYRLRLAFEATKELAESNSLLRGQEWETAPAMGTALVYTRLGDVVEGIQVCPLVHLVLA